MLDHRGPAGAGPPRNRSIPPPARGGDSNYDRIKDAVGLAEYASRFTELHQSGVTMRGACPLPGHPGDNPSAFCVYSEERRWWCHRCSEGGSVIDLVMARSGCSKWEAVVQLAEEYGVELSRGRSAGWRARAGAGRDLRLGLEDDVTEYLAQRIFDIYCGAYVDAIEDPHQNDKAMKSLWGSCWRRAQDYREQARAASGEGVSEDAS